VFKPQTVFPTSIYQAMHPKASVINPVLRARILELRGTSAAQNKSMRGGWQSRRDFLIAGDPVSEALLKLVDIGIRTASAHHAAADPRSTRLEYELISWANCSGAGDYNLVHDHPMSSWSAVYYVSCPPQSGQEPGEGNLSFIDPRNAPQILGISGHHGIRHDIQPCEGLMVMFPSWLRHAVLPHRSAQPRMSIAFNALVKVFVPGSKGGADGS